MSFLTLRSSKVQKGIQTAQQTRRENVRSEIGKQRSEGKEKPGDEYKFFFSFCCVSLLAGVRKLFVCLKGKTPKVKQEKSQTYVGRRQNRRKENCSKNARKQKLLEKWKTRQRTVNNLQEQLRNRRKKQTGKKRGKAIIRIVGKEKGGKKDLSKQRKPLSEQDQWAIVFMFAYVFRNSCGRKKEGGGRRSEKYNIVPFFPLPLFLLTLFFIITKRGNSSRRGKREEKQESIKKH